MTPLFLDSVGLIALWNQSDQWHGAARAAFERMAHKQEVLLTTSYVLLECGNAASRQPFRLEVAHLRIQLEADGMLVHPTRDDWRKAWEAYGAREAAGAGIVDHVSFAVMRRMRIRKAFTNDRHFKAAGFDTLF